MKSCFWYLVSLLFVLSSETFEQPVQLERFEEQVQETYKKGYLASVKLFETDSIRGRAGRFVGSGVVVNAEGLILTVAHVNKPGLSYRILFPDEREVAARGLGEIASVVKFDNREVGILRESLLTTCHVYLANFVADKNSIVYFRSNGTGTQSEFLMDIKS